MKTKTLNLLTQVGSWLALLAIGMIPVKLSLTYAFIFPSIVILLIANFQNFKSELRQLTPLMLPLYLLIAYGIIFAPWGFNWTHSTVALLKLLILSFSIIPFRTAFNKFGISKCLWIMVASQTLAATYSLYEARYGLEYIFLGTVTESGQLAMVIPLLLGLYSLEFKELNANKILVFFAVVIISILIAFSQLLSLPPFFDVILGLLLLGIILIGAKNLYSFLKNSQTLKANLTLLYCSLPILMSALFVNLKRGPLLGVFLALICFFFYQAKRAMLVTAIFILFLIVSLQPLRDRFADSGQHFSIAGGRQVMWSIAADLMTRYPLGVGYENSSVLRRYAREIPPEHKHFHNNYINIAVELGIIGLALFLWWILRILKIVYQNWRKVSSPQLFLASGCAIFSWSVAALVEYNFGDSEVVIIIFLLVASLSYCLRFQPEAQNQITSSK